MLMGEQEIIGVRDPFGFRPLVLGKLDDAFILASETCALDLVHADYIGKIEPGEVVIINDDGIRSDSGHLRRSGKPFAFLSTSILRVPTVSSTTGTSSRCGWRNPWALNLPSCIRSMPISLSPFQIQVTYAVLWF